MELRGGQLGEDGSLVAIIQVGSIFPIGFFDPQRAFYAENSLVNDDWRIEGGSEMDNDE